MHGPRVSVVIATWNAADVLGRCLDSVARQEIAGGFETIVVDNASTDDTAELLRRYADGIRVVANAHNARYAGANNQAAAIARGDVLFFLNSDTELLAPDVLERLAAAVDDPAVGLVGPRLLNPDGTLQPSCGAHPTVGRAVLVQSGIHRLLPDRVRARVVPHRWSHARPLEVDWVMGAAIAIRADLFAELGGFWSTMYGEEQDLARRVQDRGLRVRFEPSAQVMHVGNHSLAQQVSNAQRAAVVARAELAFLRRHYGPVRRAAIRAIVGGGYAARAVVHARLGREGPARVYGAMARAYGARAPRQ